MINTLLAKVIGTQNERELKRLRPLVARINDLEAATRELSDTGIRSKTAELRERVARGESLLDPSVTTRVLERLRTKPEDDELAGLTEQERRILDLIAEGLTNRQIGERMFLAEKTVKNYVSNLLSKLGMSRRSEAAAYAARLEERRNQEGRG